MRNGYEMASAFDAESRAPNSVGDIWSTNPDWLEQSARIRATMAVQGPYTVAVLKGESPTAAGIELIEPQLLMLGDQALVLRGYERLKDDEGSFTVLQEWRCELSS